MKGQPQFFDILEKDSIYQVKTKLMAGRNHQASDMQTIKFLQYSYIYVHTDRAFLCR